MKHRITVKLKLSPLAWQIIKRDFDFEIFAYNISGSYIYDIVKSQLTKSPEENISDDGKYEVYSIFISEHDFFQHGAVIKPEGHLLISHIIEKIERTNICNFVAIAAARGAKKDTALKHYLFENDIEGILNFQTIKKYYQRKFGKKEQNYTNLFYELEKNKHNNR